MTNQPTWKCIGHVGDVDPIAHGGGFVYVDETGVYGPEMTWFEPAPDEQWRETEGGTPVQEYRVLLERGVEEWWYGKLDSLADSTGVPVEEYRRIAQSGEPLKLAQLYYDLIHYHGAHEFDSYPVTRTEEEAYAKYADEMKLALGVAK